ncbi:hypothetical protein BDV11DRAFT_189635, partial [Aspergillus similis]
MALQMGYRKALAVDSIHIHAAHHRSRACFKALARPIISRVDEFKQLLTAFYGRIAFSTFVVGVGWVQRGPSGHDHG